MFSSRRSVKSSSSENEGEEIQTPTNKGVRVPFQDVLPQCNVQRDVKNPCSKRRSEILPGSNLTPLMRRLHLQASEESLVVEQVAGELLVSFESN
ncbi:hypothetical protein chiPu_0024786 [Chiloscyllium punctatum]|uniref:Uncharacterized protein n=1 Tax=Chiloscyllium punctatum TaxID=137246 RepID=A0A401TE95_CHIPU|nr:hypothetical protein [Chiloscyllium punctatum]